MNTNPFDGFVTLPQFIELSNGMTSMNQLRHIIRNRDYNGLAQTKCLIKVGKAYLLNIEKFREWLTNGAAPVEKAGE